jgi:hypothetical protein
MINQPDSRMIASMQQQERATSGVEDTLESSVTTGGVNGERRQTHDRDLADNLVENQVETHLDRAKRRSWVANSVSFLVWRAAHGSRSAFLLPFPGRKPGQ